MNGTITIIQPDGTQTAISRPSWERPTLKELQEAVGGYIESVGFHLPGGTEAYANEEGLLRGLAPNPTATRRLMWHHTIVGPVVFCEGFDPEED